VSIKKPIEDVDIWAEADDAIDRLAMADEDIEDLLADGVDIDMIHDRYENMSDREYFDNIYRGGKKELKVKIPPVTIREDSVAIPF
jgi:hypothetical protein